MDVKIWFTYDKHFQVNQKWPQFCYKMQINLKKMGTTWAEVEEWLKSLFVTKNFNV